MTAAPDILTAEMSDDFPIPDKAREAIERAGQLDLGVETPELPDDARDNMGHRLSNPGRDTVGKTHAAPTATEKAAALKVYPRTGSQRRLILDALALAGERGLIDEQIGALPGVADTAHRTRRNELVQGGWIEDSGTTRPTASGTESIVWILTDRAKELL